MSNSTKNTKENRKVVRATFYPPEAVFKIPDGLDLEDESVVEFWGVKWAQLYIKYVGKEEVEIIEPYFDVDETIDLKYAREEEIVDADDCGCVEYTDDEEEDED